MNKSDTYSVVVIFIVTDYPISSYLPSLISEIDYFPINLSSPKSGMCLVDDL